MRRLRSANAERLRATARRKAAQEDPMTAMIRYVEDASLEALACPVSANVASISFRLQKYRRDKESYE